MSRLRANILCDFAQVRDGVLIVASGGITRISAPAVPFRHLLHLAFIIEVGPDELDQVHELRVGLKANNSVTVLLDSLFAFTPTGSPGQFPGEATQFSLAVKIDALFLEWGAYDLSVTLDDQPEMPLTFWLVDVANSERPSS